MNNNEYGPKRDKKKMYKGYYITFWLSITKKEIDRIINGPNGIKRKQELLALKREKLKMLKSLQQR